MFKKRAYCDQGLVVLSAGSGHFLNFVEHVQNASNARLPKQVRNQMRQLLSGIRAVRKLRRCFHGKSDTQCRDALDVLTQSSGLEPKQLVSQRTVL